MTKIGNIFYLLIYAIGIGVSFYMKSKMVHIFKDNCVMSVLLGCTETIAVNHAQITCENSQQIISDALNHSNVW